MRAFPRSKCLLGHPNTGWDRRSFLGPLRVREETARTLRQEIHRLHQDRRLRQHLHALNHPGTVCPPDRLQGDESKQACARSPVRTDARAVGDSLRQDVERLEHESFVMPRLRSLSSEGRD